MTVLQVLASWFLLESKVLRLRIIRETFQYARKVGRVFSAKKVRGTEIHFV